MGTYVVCASQTVLKSLLLNGHTVLDRLLSLIKIDFPNLQNRRHVTEELVVNTA